MQAASNIEITCKSGHVYQTDIPTEVRPPFWALSTRFKIAGVDKRDEPEVRIGLSIAEFGLFCETHYQKNKATMPDVTKAPYVLSHVRLSDEIKGFGDLVTESFTSWAEFYDIRERERDNLARLGYVTEAELEALAARYEARMAELYLLSGGQPVAIDRVALPERDLFMFSNYECTCQMVEAIKDGMSDLIEGYCVLRYKGVPQERLLEAMAENAKDLIYYGFVKRY